MTVSVLIAPDKFKGTLSAKEVADAIANGLSSKVNFELFPLADGGDGSIEAMACAGFEVIEVDSGKVARKDDMFFIEAAEFCGLRQAEGQLDPMAANTLRVGFAVRSALDMGARTIVIGVGGTTSTDGGVGFLMGLGAKFLDETGELIPLGGGGLSSISAVDFSEIDSRLTQTKIILASDVDSPLLGPFGAARIFSPQKGASPQEVEVLERGMNHLAHVLESVSGSWATRTNSASESAGSGAGGGLGFASLFVGAERVAGADYFLDLLGVDEALNRCNVVVTGEGALDEQSLSGKLPIALAKRARAFGIPVFAVVGTCRLSADRLRSAGISRVFSLIERDPRCVNDSDLSKRVLTQFGSEVVGHLTVHSNDNLHP